MDRCVGAAARLPEGDRKDLAVQVLSRAAPVSDLATRHGASRKFVDQQTHKARVALDDAFPSATREDGVLFELVVSRETLRQEKSKKKLNFLLESPL
jgi:phosphopantetheine adenylyltransferase